MAKSQKIKIREFSNLYSGLISSCFSSESLVSRNSLSPKRLVGLYFRAKKKSFEFFCFIFLAFTEPTVLCAQLLMRRGGGLSGSYQFQRLFEIREHLKKRQFQSAIEFGSGASTLLFKKYVNYFISIEESESWAKNYLQAIEKLKWIPGDLLKNVQASIRILRRQEHLDQSGELICTYEIPADIAGQKFEIAYIDGPTSWIQSDKFSNPRVRDKHLTIPNTTILELAHKPQLVLVDGRRATISYLIEKGALQDSFIQIRGAYLNPPLVRPYHTTILIK